MSGSIGAWDRERQCYHVAFYGLDAGTRAYEYRSRTLEIERFLRRIYGSRT